MLIIPARQKCLAAFLKLAENAKYFTAFPIHLKYDSTRKAVGAAKLKEEW